jgi:hypothetical protein
MSKEARAYQARVTGAEEGTAYTVNGVKFDGYVDGILVDAKSCYKQFIGPDGKFHSWFRGADGFVKQAKDQLEAAKGTPIQWRFAEKQAADTVREFLQSKDVFGIEVVHVP